MNVPLVSIIIPVFNGARYLGRAIESALSQTYENLEVIVIDDGSSDEGKTRCIAEAYGRRITYVYKDNGGVATALNEGISRMRGNFFSWLSHDDMYYPGKIESQIQCYEQLGRQKAIIYSHEDLIDESDTVTRKALPFYQCDEPLPYRLMYDRFIGGCSLLIPRTAFEDAGLFNPEYRTVQDYDLWFRMMAAGYEFTYCPITSGMSRQHELQDSRSKQELHQAEKDELFLKVQKELPAKYWLEPLPDKVAGIFTLAEEFRKQGLAKAAGYDRDLLRKGLGCTSPLQRSENVARYYGLALSAAARRVRMRAKKSLKKMLLSIGLLKR